MIFNINQLVKVRLTSFGVVELEKQHLALNSPEPFQAPKKDEDGYSTFQLHALMNKFGHLMGLDKVSLPFEGDIMISVEE